MAQTQVSGSGIKDNVITNSHLHSAANIAGSKLANSGVTAGSYGSGSATLSLTINAQGLITAASTNSISTDLVNDTSPQLGGNLDSNTRDIHLNNSGDVALRWQLSGTNKWSIFHNTAGSTNHLEIFDNNGSGAAAKFFTNAGIELYHSGITKFETTSTGFEAYGGQFRFNGVEGGASQLLVYADEGDDLNDRWRLMAGGSNDFVLGNLSDGSWDTNIKAFGDGAVELYHNNSKKLETESGGTKTTGTHTVTTNIFTNEIRSITGTNDDSTSHVSISARNAAGGHGEYFIVGVSGNIYFGAGANSYSSNPSGNNLNGATTIRVFGGISSNAYQDAHRFGRDADGSIIILQSAGGTEGSISISGSTTSYNTSSDYRLKENIIDIEDGITRLKNLKPKRFNFIKDPSITKDGFIAHEVSSIVPEAVQGTKDETYNKDEDDNNIKAGDPKYQVMDAGKLIPLLTAAVKEAIAKIETLEAEVAALKAG